MRTRHRRTVLKSVALAALLLQMLLIPGALAQIRSKADFVEHSKGWGGVVADFDRDGHADIFVSGHDPDDRLWYWTPTGYIPAPTPFPWFDRHACDAADVNRDGLLDLYCAIGVEKGTGVKANEMWIQRPNGQFVRAAGFGAEDPTGRGRIPLFFDFNHDEFPDLYVTNEATARPDGQPNFNHVYVNQAGNGFSEVTTLATGARGFTCVAKGDINGDGWDDLLVCSEPAGGHLYLNDRAGNFTELSSRATAVRWLDAQLVDMNGDGRDDLVSVNAENKFQVWLNSGSGSFYTTPSFEDLLPSRAASLAAADLDGNGVKDVYVVLQDADCRTTLRDLAPDVVYLGRIEGGWRRETLQQSLSGCGHLARVIEPGSVLLENGGPGWNGPSYVLRFAE